MPREILVIQKEKLFRNNDEFEGFLPSTQNNLIQTILRDHEYQERNDALETNSAFQQPIPYVWIINPETKQALIYKRSPSGGEVRLRNKYSGGIGGHIDKDTEHQSENPIEDAMMRELKEELIMNSYPTPKIVGFINENQTEVGKVHFGVTAIAETNETPKPGEDVESCEFKSVAEIDALFADQDSEVESWTEVSWPFVKNYLNSL